MSMFLDLIWIAFAIEGAFINLIAALFVAAFFMMWR